MTVTVRLATLFSVTVIPFTCANSSTLAKSLLDAPNLDLRTLYEKDASSVSATGS